MPNQPAPRTIAHIQMPERDQGGMRHERRNQVRLVTTAASIPASSPSPARRVMVLRLPESAKAAADRDPVLVALALLSVRGRVKR